MDYSGKTVAITGGNSGIGLSTAIKFSELGANVSILGRNKDTLAEAGEAIKGPCLSVRGDVANLGDIDKFLEETAAKYGHIDHLVVNAGVAKEKPIHQVDEDFFDWHFNINVKGAFFTVQKAIPHFNREGGSIVLVGSTVHNQGWPGFTVYTATKAAMRSFARTMSRDLLPQKIRVNILSPGVVETPIIQKMGFDDEDMRTYEKTLPIQRYGQPEEMASAILYLCSKDASYILGTELLVDGGVGNLGYIS